MYGGYVPRGVRVDPISTSKLAELSHGALT